MAWLNLDSISPSSQSKASPLSRNSSAMRREQSVDLRWMLKSNVAFSCACRLSGSSPFTITNFLLNSLTPGVHGEAKRWLYQAIAESNPPVKSWDSKAGTTYKSWAAYLTYQQTWSVGSPSIPQSIPCKLCPNLELSSPDGWAALPPQALPYIIQSFWSLFSFPSLSLCVFFLSFSPCPAWLHPWSQFLGSVNSLESSFVINLPLI